MVSPTIVAVGLAERDLVAGLLDLRLPVGDVAHLDVEHVDLAVDRDALAVGAEHHRGVGELLLSGTTSGTLPATRWMPSSRAQPAAALSAGPSSGSARGADRLGRAQHGPLLRQDDQLGAVGGGAAHEALGNLQVAVVFVGGVELYGGGAHIFPGRGPASAALVRVRLTDQSI